MSVAAIQLLDHLRENGVEDQRAIKIAEAFDKRIDDAMREAKAHADKGRAESEARAEEKAKAQFVTADEYHKRDKTLATREDLNAATAAVRAEIAAVRAENRADNAETRAEVRTTNRLILGGFITVVVGIVTIVAGIAALVVKAFIGA